MRHTILETASPGNRILPQVAIGGRRHVGEGQSGAFPEQAGRALAGGVQSFQMKKVFAGAQAQRAAVVAEGVAGRAADLCEGWAGFSHFDAVDDQARAVAGDQMKGVAAVGGNVDAGRPRRRRNA